MLNFYELVIVVTKILFILFFFGFCIFIHEFGHLLAAMWRGLHIEKFSIGFGKPILKWRKNNIDYLLSWLPFGGYVALPQLDPSDNPKTSVGDPLPLAKPVDRTITAVAGPLFNILFGFALACIIWQVGVEGPPPAESFTVGHIPKTYTGPGGNTQSNPEYEAGLRVGDVVTAVNGETFTKGWQEAAELIVYSPNGKVKLTVLRDGKPKIISYGLVPNSEFDGLGYPFMNPLLPTTVGDVVKDSPAMRAGLKKGDILSEINGERVINSGMLVEKIQEVGSAAITLKITRGDSELVIPNIRAETKILDGTETYLIGIHIETSSGEFIKYYPTPIQQFTDVIVRTYKTFRGLFDPANPIKAKHMSGPVGIFHMLYLVVSNAGIMAALNLVIIITFSLAIINLFPLPILDGGHITLGIIEMVTHRRIPTKVNLCLSYAFAVLILGFIVYVSLYDVKRVHKSVYPAKPKPAEKDIEQITNDSPAKPEPEPDIQSNPN